MQENKSKPQLSPNTVYAVRALPSPKPLATLGASHTPRTLDAILEKEMRKYES